MTPAERLARAMGYKTGPDLMRAVCDAAEMVTEGVV